MARLKRVTAPETQGQMFPHGEDRPRTERTFEIKIVAEMKGDDGKDLKIPLIVTKERGLLFWDVLEMCLTDRRNRNIIEAYLDNPSSEEIAAIEQQRAQQGEGQANLDETA